MLNYNELLNHVTLSKTNNIIRMAQFPVFSGEVISNISYLECTDKILSIQNNNSNRPLCSTGTNKQILFLTANLSKLVFKSGF